MGKKKELYEYKLRQCRTVHECCVCKKDIYCGDLYYDGGYGRRCHEQCAYIPPDKG